MPFGIGTGMGMSIGMSMLIVSCTEGARDDGRLVFVVSAFDAGFDPMLGIPAMPGIVLGFAGGFGGGFVGV